MTLKLFPLQIQSFEKNNKIKYLEFVKFFFFYDFYIKKKKIEYKKLFEGDYFGGRALLSLDPILSKIIRNNNARLTVVSFLFWE